MSAQDSQRREQLGRRGAAGDLHRGQDLQVELPQVTVGGDVERTEMALIAREAGYPAPALPGSVAIRSARPGSDRPRPRRRSTLGGHRARLGGPLSLCRARQRVAHRAFGLALPRRHRLVETSSPPRRGHRWPTEPAPSTRSGRRCGSRRWRASAVSRRPTVARNRRRSAGNTDRSSVSAPSSRRNSSPVTSALVLAGEASTARSSTTQPGHSDLGVHQEQPVQPHYLAMSL